MSQKNADSPGGRGSDGSLTALSVGQAPLHLQDIDLGRMTLGICSLELHSVCTCVCEIECVCVPVHTQVQVCACVKARGQCWLSPYFLRFPLEICSL